MTDRVTVGALSVDAALYRFVEQEVMPGLDLAASDFWAGLEAIVTDLAPRNGALLAERARLQKALDEWHRANPGPVEDTEAYEAFLRDLGYLVEAPEPFTIATEGLDPEVSTIAGPQLVVPVDNARYALNAANARWGSLYDALYGTDALGSTPPPGDYDRGRGAQVIARAKQILDDIVPLQSGGWAQVTGLSVVDGALRVACGDAVTGLGDPEAFVGWQGPANAPTGVLLRHHGLHVHLHRDPSDSVGADDPMGLADIHVEAAISTIMDAEDSVAAVSTDEKVGVYENWLGLMRGDLEATVRRGDREITRRLADDRHYETTDGPLRIKGRGLMLVRNVGHLTTHAMVTWQGKPVPEGILDAVITSAIAMHNRTSVHKNSATDAIYIVKPKMHGPDEVAFACTLFDRVERMLGLSPNTIKMGIMDEERRTSINLAACIHAARDRVFFINTGFLDRTGDDIHSTMQAGPVVPKGKIKSARWLAAYEARNVAIGLACGFAGRAQIGKGMWAMPDLMADMLDHKIAHPRSGATTAWVPSPTAATLHALHYHQVNVAQVQAQLADQPTAPVADLMSPGLVAGNGLNPATISTELERNAQSILGYVVRWVDQGIGCSKVPDIDDVALMEDRATLRISSQLLANWLTHGLCSEADVRAAFARMAGVVNAQNAGDPAYRKLEPGTVAFDCAVDLALQGATQPSGYTEPLLIAARSAVLTGGW